MISNSRSLVNRFFIGYLLGFAALLIIRSTIVPFTDSPRYFLIDNDRHLLNELWEHSGAYIQTTLFSLFNSNNGPFFANLFIWVVSSIALVKYVSYVGKNNKLIFLVNLFIILLFTSNMIANWIIGISSESIGLSILFLVLIPSVLKFLNLSRKLKFESNFILFSLFFLMLSKPLWAALLAPLIALIIIDKSTIKKFAPILLLILFGSAFITLKSASRPYEDTSLTYSGWYSLTRAYAYSMENRLGEVALGDIKECKPVLDLLIAAQKKGTPSRLYYEFNAVSQNCPGLAKNLNENPKNTPLVLLRDDLSKSWNLFLVSLSTMTNPVVYTNESLSSNQLLSGLNFVFHTGSYVLLASVLALTFAAKNMLKEILLLAGYSISGAFLIYIQDGIEWERHMLPMTMLMVTAVWLSIISFISKLSTKNVET